VTGSLSLAEYQMLTGKSCGGRPGSKPRKDEEHHSQVALMKWANLAEAGRPELALLHSTPNGGHRHPATAAKMKAEGQKAGVLDLQLPVASAPYIGLWIEMKAGKNKPTKEQLWWAQQLTEQGHCCCLAYDWQTARDMILSYLDGQPFDNGFSH